MSPLFGSFTQNDIPGLFKTQLKWIAFKSKQNVLFHSSVSQIEFIINISKSDAVTQWFMVVDLF